jgi:hypothetical protein
MWSGLPVDSQRRAYVTKMIEYDFLDIADTTSSALSLVFAPKSRFWPRRLP